MDKVELERRPGGGGYHTVQILARRQISKMSPRTGSLESKAGKELFVCLGDSCRSTIN